MKSRAFRNILWCGLAGVMVFAPLARGTVRIWSITLVEAAVLVLVFLWLWRVNNKTQITQITNADYTDDVAHSSRHKAQNTRLRRTALDKPILAFVVLAVISCIFSIYKHASWLEILRLLTMLGVFYLVVNNFGRRMTLRLSTLLIIMGAGMSLLGLGQYFLGLEHSWWRPNTFLASTYVNHNHFSGYLELVIPLAIGIGIGLKPQVLSSRFQFLIFRFGLIMALIMMFVALVIAQSRGAWACLPISLIAMNIVLVRRRVLKKETLVILLLLIVVGVAFFYGGYDDVARRLRTVEQINKEDFLKGRIRIWQGSINMIKAHPLYGTGIGTFVWGLPYYRSEGLTVRAHYAHNDYLHMMAEMGLLALPLMLWMVWIVVVAGFKWRDKEGLDKGWIRDDEGRGFGLMEGIVLGSAVGILSLALHGLVDFNFHIPANMLVVACLAGMIMRRTGKE